MFRILAFLIISISGMGCTFDTSGVAFNNAPVDLQATADEGLRHDVGPKLDASLDIPLPDMLMDISPPDVPFDQSQLDLPPDNQVLDMPIPDAPILDAPIPDAPILDHFPWPDLVPAPDMTPPDTTPWPDLFGWPDMVPSPDVMPTPDLVPPDLVSHDKVPFGPDLFPLPNCKTLFGNTDGYKLCKETTTTCRFWHDEGLFGGSYDCNKLCKTHKCLGSNNTSFLNRCSSSSSVSCSSNHNAGTCTCSKW